ncbi:MAG: DUF998 domain-containing protein [Flavobacteriaceae bacterium]
MRNTVFWTGLAGSIIFIAISVWGGLRLEGYNFIRQYISESYATGIQGSELLRYGFMISGLLLASFCFLAPIVLPKSKLIKTGFWGIGLFYGLGTLITGIFPCDLGGNPNIEVASLSQIIHNFSASLTYMIVPFCMILIGIKASHWTKGKNTALITLVCGLIAAVFVLILFSDPFSNLKGLYQRIIEGSILFWILYMAFYVKRHSAR